MSSKNPEKSCSEAKVTCSRARQRKQTTSCSGYRWRRRGCPFWSRRIRCIQSSCSSKNCVIVFMPTLRFLSKSKMKRVVSCAGVTFSFNSRMMAKKSWQFGWPSEARRPDMVRREDTKGRSNQRFKPPVQRDVLSVFTKKFCNHRQLEMHAPKSPFYLAVNHNRRSNEEVWYMKAPHGKKMRYGSFCPLQRRMLAFTGREKSNL